MSHWTKNIIWKFHTGASRPVSENTRVAYRTIYTDGAGDHISHVHIPVAAKCIDWGHVKGFGRIHSFVVVG